MSFKSRLTIQLINKGAGCRFSYKNSNDEITFITDPYENNSHAYDAIKYSKFVFTSHGHPDHNDGVPEALILNPEIKYYAPLRSLENVRIKFSRIDHQVNLNERMEEAVPWGTIKLSEETTCTVLPSNHIFFNPALIFKTACYAFLSNKGRSHLDISLLSDLPETVCGKTVSYYFYFGREGNGFGVQFLGSAGTKKLKEWRNFYSNPKHPLDVLILPYQGREDMPEVANRIIEAAEPKKAVFIIHRFNCSEPITKISSEKADPFEFREQYSSVNNKIKIIIPEVGESETWKF